jgi:hypothetical protein
MRWWVVAVLVLAACASPWERHVAQRAQREAQGDYAGAAAQTRWMIDNAFEEAPAQQNTPEAEARRYLELADLAAKAHNPRLAVEALREALIDDPHQGPAVRAQLDRLPVSPAERERLRQEFRWNITVLSPEDGGASHAAPAPAACWSYRVEEIRIRSRGTLRTLDGMQRRIVYDVRPWVFDAATARWHPGGGWVDEAGTATEFVDGPPQPRFRALSAAAHVFYADGVVPPCHRGGWRGPYSRDGRVFVAAQLPGNSAAARGR